MIWISVGSKLLWALSNKSKKTLILHLPLFTLCSTTFPKTLNMFHFHLWWNSIIDFYLNCYSIYSQYLSPHKNIQFLQLNYRMSIANIVDRLEDEHIQFTLFIFGRHAISQSPYKQKQWHTILICSHINWTAKCNRILLNHLYLNQMYVSVMNIHLVLLWKIRQCFELWIT